MDIEGALSYPTNDDDWLKTVGIGGGILLVPGALSLFVFVLSIVTFGIGGILFLVVAPIQLIASAFILGYYVEVIRETIRGNDVPPTFSDWGKLGKDGAMALLISIVYQLPMLLLFGAAFAVFFLFVGVGGMTGSESASAGLSLVGIVAFFAVGALSLVYSLVVGYLMPISLCAYAQEGDLGAAFSTSILKEVGTASEYMVAWAVGIGGLMVLNNFLGFLNFLLIGFFIQFYVFVALSRVLGEAYAESLNIEAVHDGPATGSTDWSDDGSPAVDD